MSKLVGLDDTVDDSLIDDDLANGNEGLAAFLNCVEEGTELVVEVALLVGIVLFEFGLNELSCDGPLTPPYTAYMQGGLTYEYGKLGVMTALEEMLKA